VSHTLLTYHTFCTQQPSTHICVGLDMAKEVVDGLLQLWASTLVVHWPLHQWSLCFGLCW